MLDHIIFLLPIDLHSPVMRASSEYEEIMNNNSIFLNFLLHFIMTEFKESICFFNTCIL